MLYKELCTNKYLVLILNINILENISENITSLINCAFFYEYSLYISDLLVSILYFLILYIRKIVTYKI